MASYSSARIYHAGVNVFPHAIATFISRKEKVCRSMEESSSGHTANSVHSQECHTAEATTGSPEAAILYTINAAALQSSHVFLTASTVLVKGSGHRQL